MAEDVRWLGRAGAVADEITLTIAGTWVAAETLTVTINGKDLVLTIGTSVATTDVATALKEAWEGETFTDTTYSVRPSDGGPAFAEHSELTATVSGSVVTLKGDTRGVPWYSGLSVSETSAAGTITPANSVPATGPNHVDNTDNWSTGNVPGSVLNATVWIDDSSVSLLYGVLDPTNALTALNIAASFTGDIGLPKTNASGYPEFRDDYLVVKTPIIKIGYGEGSGSGRIKLDAGATAVTSFLVESTGSSAEQGIGALVFKNSAASTGRIYGGSISFAPHNADTANFTSLKIDGGTIQSHDSVTLGTITVDSGTVALRTATTSLTVNNGDVTIDGSGVATSITVLGGTVKYNSSGALTAAAVGSVAGGGVLDFTANSGAPTVSTLTVSPGGTVINSRRVTVTTWAFGSNVQQVAVA